MLSLLARALARCGIMKSGCLTPGVNLRGWGVYSIVSSLIYLNEGCKSMDKTAVKSHGWEVGGHFCRI